MKHHIVAIGPLPPPLHGFSYATSAMTALLSEENVTVLQNLSPPENAGRLVRHASKLRRVLGACGRLLLDRRLEGKACYLGCDGGWGMWYTLLIVIASRLLAYPTYLHHHSFRYIDKPGMAMRGILALGGPSLTHVFLCEIMRDRFVDAYAVRLRSVIISNAAFVAPADDRAALQPRPLTIGMLSNLSREKGLETFIELLRQCRSEGLAVQAILAGPVANNQDRTSIEAAVKEFGGALDYRGAVYDEAKAAFYGNIDVFVFPSGYVNEAQPIVIFEAKAAGCAVIAYNRGCIRKQLDGSDLLIPANGDFVPTSIAWIAAIPPDSPRSTWRRRTRQDYAERHQRALKRARSLLE
jgi:glycosyltransferase involved in cell wall biosynthesis